MAQVTNALGHATRYDDYDAHGRVTKMTDPNGLVTTLSYTPRGWLETRDVGGELGLDYSYYPTGRLASAIDSAIDSAAGSFGSLAWAYACILVTVQVSSSATS